MSEIIKTNAFLLGKLNYGESSKILKLYTESAGKISAMAKGSRSMKSGRGNILDYFNLIEIIYYSKPNREIQVISSYELLEHYNELTADFLKNVYASAVIELTSVIVPENEPDKKLFEALKRMLSLMNLRNAATKLLFSKYFLFIIKHAGYEFSFDTCEGCGKVFGQESLFADIDSGNYCAECSRDRKISFHFTPELLNLLKCISRKNFDNQYNESDLDKIITFMEKFLIHHLPEFKGIKSLKLL